MSSRIRARARTRRRFRSATIASASSRRSISAIRSRSSTASARSTSGAAARPATSRSRTRTERSSRSARIFSNGSRTPHRKRSLAMKTSLDGQVAIVTGAARGIGLGIARLMAERGAQIVVWDRDLEPLKATPGFTPAMAQSVDVADYGSVERAFNAAVAKFGQIHIIVNNAGINGPIKPTWEYPLEDWDRVVAIDMTSVFYASRL